MSTNVEIIYTYHAGRLRLADASWSTLQGRMSHLTYLPAITSESLPLVNLISTLPFTKLRPITVSCRPPDSGPRSGETPVAAYDGPTMPDTSRDTTSLSQRFRQPPKNSNRRPLGS